MMASIVPKGCTIRRVKLKASGVEIAFGCNGKPKPHKLIRGVRHVVVGMTTITGSGSRIGFDFGATCSREGSVIRCKPN